MQEVDDLLAPLAALLKQNGLKSKQAAINRHFDDLRLAKELASWEVIASKLNDMACENFNSKTINVLYHRAKAKKNKNAKLEKKVVLPSKTNVVDSRSPSVPTSEVTEDLLRNYKAVCFENERIALRAIENGVSIDLIRSWQCANYIQLGQSLGNYLRNK
ncbi:hypothetical protein IFG57_004017 [Salmonella enterica]|nr:hypothetical protein [Salmonella enterica]